MDASDATRMSTLVRTHGADAVAFQGLAASMRVWFDEEASDPAGAAVAYFDTGGAWVASGGPVCADPERAAVAKRFVDAAARARRRACFFGVEDARAFAGWRQLHIGEQPSGTPDEWMETLRAARTLREQLRRARAKGVVAQVIPASDVAPGTPLRASLDRLLVVWLDSRRIEPMGFLVSPDPYTLPDDHVYVVARRGDVVVGLLSAVPAYAGRGWLVEHLVCATGSPNGTAETLLDSLYHSRAAEGHGGDTVTLGLAPLAGRKRSWQAIARSVARPLFDFEGLHAFKARLRPSRWQPVWLVAPPGSSRMAAIFDVLTAFAAGSLVGFAVRSLLGRPRALLWLLAIGLVPWTLLLVWLDVSYKEGVAGYSRAALAAWIAFDVVLAAGLFRAALRPARWALVTLTLAALGDGTLSVLHLHDVGIGPNLPDSLLRLAAALAPFIGAGTLVHVAIQRAREVARSMAATHAS